VLLHGGSSVEKKRVSPGNSLLVEEPVISLRQRKMMQRCDSRLKGEPTLGGGGGGGVSRAGKSLRGEIPVGGNLQSGKLGKKARSRRILNREGLKEGGRQPKPRV